MRFIRKNITNILLIIVFMIIFLVPDVKAFLLSGLMNIGFYTPEIEQPRAVQTNLDGIQFSDINGNVVDLGNLRGKVIFLNFWATWCPPCRAEMPSINKLYQQFKQDKDFVFIFADADGDLKKANQFMQRRKYDLPVFKVDRDIPEQIFAGSLPTTVIFDQKGRLSFKHEGMANYADKKFIDFLNRLKAAK